MPSSLLSQILHLAAMAQCSTALLNAAGSTVCAQYEAEPDQSGNCIGSQ